MNNANLAEDKNRHLHDPRMPFFRKSSKRIYQLPTRQSLTSSFLLSGKNLYNNEHVAIKMVRYRFIT